MRNPHAAAVDMPCQSAWMCFHLQQVWEEVDVLRDSELQALQVQTKEAKQFMCQEVVVEQLSGESAKHQIPHDFTIHCSHLAYKVPKA